MGREFGVVEIVLLADGFLQQLVGVKGLGLDGDWLLLVIS